MIQYSIMPLNDSQFIDSKLNNLIIEDEDDFVIDDDNGESFLMLRQFENLKDFLLKVGQIFAYVDSLQELNSLF